MLYQAELAGVGAEETIRVHFEREPEPEPAIRAFSERLVRWTLAHLDEVDDLIGELCHNWSLERLAAIDRNLLRLGVAELRSEPDTPGAVVIDEAVELAREFADSESGAFVNGILEAARKRLRPDAETGPR
jgi:N utilization substance protein B